MAPNTSYDRVQIRHVLRIAPTRRGLNLNGVNDDDDRCNRIFSASLRSHPYRSVSFYLHSGLDRYEHCVPVGAGTVGGHTTTNVGSTDPGGEWVSTRPGLFGSGTKSLIPADGEIVRAKKPAPETNGIRDSIDFISSPRRDARHNDHRRSTRKNVGRFVGREGASVFAGKGHPAEGKLG